MTGSTGILCQNCGMSNPLDYSFCGRCGKALRAESVAEPNEAPKVAAEPKRRPSAIPLYVLIIGACGLLYMLNSPRGGLAPLAGLFGNDYRSKAADWTSQYSTAFRAFSRLNESPRLGSASWRLDVADQIEAIRAVDDEILAYKAAPPEYAKSHSYLQSAANHYERAMVLYKEGTDKLDAGLLEAGANELSNANADIERATLALPVAER